MKNIVKTILVFLVVFSSPIWAEEDEGWDVELNPLSVGAFVSYMQIFNVNDSMYSTGNFSSTVNLPQTTLWLVQSAKLGDRVSANLGIAGSFFYPFPEDNVVGYTSYRLGGLAIFQANVITNIGDVESPWLKVTVGQQGYKYNQYSKNLGEYLFRSDPYPTIVRTGDWGAIDNAAAGLWGIVAQASFLEGMIKNDIVLNFNNERLPLHDIHISDLVMLDLGGVFKIGGGIKMNSIIPMNKDKTKYKHKKSGYFTWTAQDQANLDKYVTATSKTFEYFDALGVQSNDTALIVGQVYWANSQRPLITDFLMKDHSEDIAAGTGYDTLAVAFGANKLNSIEFIDQRTNLIMGMAALDFSKWGFNGSIYAEIAVLGWTNYPIFYENRSHRTPKTVGLNFPTFGFFDFINLEFEWWENPNMNSDLVPALFRHPTPKGIYQQLEQPPLVADPNYDGQKNTNGEEVLYGRAWTEDDFKWSLSVQKSFGKKVNIAGQVARDHFRPLNPFFRPNYTEATLFEDSWYYNIRLLVNL